MTPDDEVVKKQAPKSQKAWQARPNVHFEIGWFMARLRRKRVLLILKGELKIPSDLSGILHCRFENAIKEVSEDIRKRLKKAGVID